MFNYPFRFRLSKSRRRHYPCNETKGLVNIFIYIKIDWVTNQLRTKGIIFPLAVLPRLGASETSHRRSSRPSCRLVRKRSTWWAIFARCCCFCCALHTLGLERASCRLCDCDHRIIVISFSSGPPPGAPTSTRRSMLARSQFIDSDRHTARAQCSDT